MAFINNMSSLLNSVERKLGLLLLDLPKKINKDTWANEVIIPETLQTFSRYYPYLVKYYIDENHPKKYGWYYLDEKYIDNYQILGIRDVNWRETANFCNHGIYDLTRTDLFMTGFDSSIGVDEFEGVSGIFTAADRASIYGTNTVVLYEAPNRFKLDSNFTNAVFKSYNVIVLDLLVVHNKDLTTIPPTMMEIFTDLATADVAGYLFHQLKYFSDFETVFGNVDLKLDYLERKSEERNELIEKIRDSYVSTSNANQPLIFAI